ncbi:MULTISPECIES: hypothetical protein [Methylomicrobium]|uniref:hypothetical protein n=1 Tax=Methylomicrobium TaxID=39773 RepID=UPI0002623E9D|nr:MULTISPECIES: hypothetical protein [Methylomicrobium]
MTAPIIDPSGERLGSGAGWLDLANELARRDKERRLAVEKARLRVALDNAGTGFSPGDRTHPGRYLER